MTKYPDLNHSDRVGQLPKW